MQAIMSNISFSFYILEQSLDLFCVPMATLLYWFVWELVLR